MAKVKRVSIYDPVKKAFCEVDIEVAKQFIESAKKAEEEIKKIESGEEE